MILYFDSYITDVPFNPKFVDPNSRIRQSSTIYRMPAKLDIAKYTLASYALYPWTFVLIRYELQDGWCKKDFESYVRTLFPTALIIEGRSFNQAEYLKSIEIMERWDDDWIWYAPNNDHPIIANDYSIIDQALERAKKYSNLSEYVSIYYSHFSEFINISRKGSAFWRLFGRDTTILEEDSDFIVFIKDSGDPSSIQIVNKALFRHWFASTDLNTKSIIRSEDVNGFITTHKQIIITPKKEIAAHFDGYSHTIGGLAEISPEQVPPLFIPPGFFDGEIKIVYGFKDYKPGYTNINPDANSYSFEKQKFTTDLKLSLNEIPFFWRSRIISMEINPEFSFNKKSIQSTRNEDIKLNPYLLKNKKINISNVKSMLRCAYYSIKNIFNA